MKKFLLFPFILCVIVSVVTAQELPKQVLKAGDVKKFIKTYPQLKADMERFGSQYESQSSSVTIPEAMIASAEFKGILKKHGWDEKFFEKTGVISLGYSYAIYIEEMKKAEAGFEKSSKEIKENTQLTEEMKKQLLEQMQAARGAMKTQKSEFSHRIHPKDIELIRPHVEELRELFEDS